MKTKSLLFLALLMVSFSCSKDKDDPIILPISDIVGTWNKVSTETRTENTEWVADNRSCLTDDTEEFRINGTWSSYDGTSQCNPGSGVQNGTWTLTAGNTKVVFTYDGFSGSYESTVTQLNANTMVLTYSSGDIAGTQNRITYSK